MLTSRLATGNRPPEAAAALEVNAWRDETGAVFARGYADEDRYWIEWPDLATFGFRRGSLQVEIWLDDARRHADALDVMGRVLQPMMLEALGWQALHASAVIVAGAAIAFCGRSGHGKSTIAYALAGRGHRQLADDALVVEIDGPSVSAVPLPFTPRLRPESRRRFAEAPSPRPVTAPRVPVGGVFLLDQHPDGRRLEIVAVPKVSAFAELLTHAHCFDPAAPPAKARLVARYLDLAERLPVWRLRYPEGLDGLDAVCDAVTATVAAAQPRVGLEGGPAR